MIRRSIRRTATAVMARTIPITSRRCHSSMASDSTAERLFLMIGTPLVAIEPG